MGRSIYFIDTNRFKIGRSPDDNGYLFYNGVKRDIKLRCLRFSKISKNIDLVNFDCNYKEDSVSLIISIPEDSKVTLSIGSNIIRVQDKYVMQLDYDKEYDINITSQDEDTAVDTIKLMPIKDRNATDSEDSLKDNIPQTYSDEVASMKGAEDLSELVNLINILEKIDNINRVNRGAHRVVYDISDINLDILDESDGDIIKVSLKDQSVTQNRLEVQTWQTVKGTEIERYFCPITNFGSDYKYIVMEKAEVIEGDVSKQRIEEWNNRSDEIRDKIEKNNWFNSYDISFDNIGKYNGRYVLIDYPFGANIEE